MKLRTGRLVVLAALAGGAYWLNEEIKKNPELVKDAKKQWNNVKGEISKTIENTRNQAEDVIRDMEGGNRFGNEVEEKVEDIKSDAKNFGTDVKTSAGNAKEEVGDFAQDVKNEVEDTAQDVKNNF